MRILVIAVAAIVFLAGCQAGLGVRAVSDLTRDLREMQVSFVLNQEVTVPAGRARLFLQDGGVVGNRSYYRPHCILEVDPVDHNGFGVSAGTFDVVRVQRTTVDFAALEDLRLAGTPPSLSFLDGGTQRLHDGDHFWLESDAQQSVMRLTCYGVYAPPVDLKPPTLEEINAALGEVGTIRAR